MPEVALAGGAVGMGENQAEGGMVGGTAGVLRGTAGARVGEPAGKATAAGARVEAAEELLFAVGGLRARAARAQTMAVLSAEEAVPESSMRALLGSKGGGRGGR